MGALADARHELEQLLEGEGLHVVSTPSKGHLTPPAVIVSPGAEWLVLNAQLGRDLHMRVSLTVTFIAGKLAAESSLLELEQLIETAAPALAGQRWVVTAVGQPYAMAVAATEYLASSATLTRQVILPPSS